MNFKLCENVDSKRLLLPLIIGIAMTPSRGVRDEVICLFGTRTGTRRGLKPSTNNRRLYWRIESNKFQMTNSKDYEEKYGLQFRG